MHDASSNDLLIPQVLQDPLSLWLSILGIDDELKARLIQQLHSVWTNISGAKRKSVVLGQLMSARSHEDLGHDRRP
jgi:hypothetical protein